MLIEDCLELVNQSFIKVTKGIQSDATVRCSSCLQQLSKGTDPITVFPCGHCFHAREECGNYQSCPICTGGIIRGVSSTQENTMTKISTRRIQQLMRRMEFSLKKNWGNSKESKDNSAAAYFAKKEDTEEATGFVDFSFLGCPESVIPIKFLTEEEKAQEEAEAEVAKEEKRSKKHRKERTKHWID